jgi:hypothetical protein
MKPTDKLRIARSTIGQALYDLKLAKNEPTNYTDLYIRINKQKLSMALSTQARILRELPELRRTRVEQMELL